MPKIGALRKNLRKIGFRKTNDSTCSSIDDDFLCRRHICTACALAKKENFEVIWYWPFIDENCPADMEDVRRVWKSELYGIATEK